MNSTISKPEFTRRKKLMQAARMVVMNTLPIEDATETGLMMEYDGFYLQVGFSQMHPLMFITFLRKLSQNNEQRAMHTIKDLNLKSILGCHAVNTQAVFYSYRAAHWLDAEMTKARFLEILDRSFEEVYRAYVQL